MAGVRAAVDPLGVPLRRLVPQTAKALAEQLDLHTRGDLLRYYPRRYRKRGDLTDMASLVIGEAVTVWAKVDRLNARSLMKNGRRLHLTTLTLTDGRNSLECTFFNQPWMARVFPAGAEGLFSGKVKRFGRKLQLDAPQAEVLDDVKDDQGRRIEKMETFAGGLIPIYPLAGTMKLRTVQRSVHAALADLPPLPDPLPEVLLAKHGLVDLTTALTSIHRPESEAALGHAQHRLRYDEALSMQLVLAQRRARATEFPAEPCPAVDDGLLAAFDRNLPFTLTAGQRQVGATISRDLAGIHPMNRLLQGEVGSGKTVVALRAMLQVVDAGRQTVLLAPTEVLAGQHARTLSDMLGPLATAGQLGAADLATRVTLLTGSLSAPARRQVLADIASGDAGIVVGTHALLGPGVSYAGLGLVVVDEQHRFGVEQRDQLRSQNPTASPPHVLVMTATPIPRTVAMTVYGDLETSTLRELPSGRSPISTTVVPAAEKPQWLDRAWQRVREEVAGGRQVYVVCPRIGDDGDETDGVDGDFDADGPDEMDSDERRPPLSVLDTFRALHDGPLAGLRLAQLHGRLASADKDAVMNAFKAGDLDVLVSTTVIEVGVDVPNATLMIVLDADRFGISQLHQLRGRVGRGSAAGTCLLVTESGPNTPARVRLDTVAGTTDGFALARADLELRREGDVLGRLQAGRSSTLRLLSLLRDEPIIVAAREDAVALIDADRELAGWPGLSDMVASALDEQSQEFLEKG